MLRKFDNSQLKKISDWTSRELNTLRKESRIPVITKLPNGNYKVASYLVEKQGAEWTADGKLFFDKKSAIFYCALLHVNNFVTANELQKLDSDVGRLEFDKIMYRVRLDKAHEENDQFKIDLYTSRYLESKMLYKTAKSQLDMAITHQFRRLDINKSNTTF